MSTELYSFQNIEIDSFVDKYYNNKQKFKEVIRVLQVGEKAMFDRMVRLENENRKLKSEIKKITDFEHESKSIIGDLKKDKHELQDKVRNLQKLIEVDNQIEMYKYVAKKKIMSGDLAEQYKTVLLKCGVIQEKDSNKIDMPINSDDYGLKSSGNIIQMIQEKEKEHSDNINREDNSGDEYADVPMDELIELLGFDKEEK